MRNFNNHRSTYCTSYEYCVSVSHNWRLCFCAGKNWRLGLEAWTGASMGVCALAGHFSACFHRFSRRASMMLYDRELNPLGSSENLQEFFLCCLPVSPLQDRATPVEDDRLPRIGPHIRAQILQLLVSDSLYQPKATPSLHDYIASLYPSKATPSLYFI